jgi:murein DD-endopeptidase MepM/ murein hydrolase activator NlpD
VVDAPRLILRLTAFAGLIVLAGAAVLAFAGTTPVPQPQAAAAPALVAPEPAWRTTTHEVSEGETAAGVLRGLGAPSEPILAAAKGALDQISVGDSFKLDSLRGEAVRLRVEHDPTVSLDFERDGNRWRLAKRPIPYAITTGARHLTVTSSLWEAGVEGGLSPRQIMGLAGIFEYDVDFNTELVAGAKFDLVADALTGDDGATRVGDVRAAILTNGKEAFTAVRYRTQDGATGWFAADGTARKKAFLRSPLAFSRVTSSFGSRFHPVLRITRQHKGVDFGAPSGTPVRAVADGTVLHAGPHGGHGNFVQLDHEGPYGTGYAHLSKILVKRGQRVRQGETVGLVGSTGVSTGPHLHYEFTVNGTHQNPMTAKIPLTVTLPDGEKAAFFAVRDEALRVLGG